jgi:glycosyltransferase involved in cell wall biosynthesis
VKISIIMATLNAAKHVAGALESIQMQNHPDLELVVVDGVSTDDTMAIVGRYPALKPLVLQGPDNGVYDAMNKGIARASGDAYFFLNADDRLADPDALASLAKTSAASGAVLTFGDIVVCGQQADRLRSHRLVNKRRLGFESLSHQAVLARKGAFDSVGRFDQKFRICADLDWFMRCGERGLTFVHLPRVVCRCLTGGLSDQHYDLQLQEVAQILRLYRSPVSRATQRVAAAVRRRVQRLAQGVA